MTPPRPVPQGSGLLSAATLVVYCDGGINVGGTGATLGVTGGVVGSGVPMVLP